MGKCINSCQVKQANAALSKITFDEEACEQGTTGKRLSCRGAYDKASAALLGLKTPICPPCLDATAQANLADAMMAFREQLNGQIYCAVLVGKVLLLTSIVSPALFSAEEPRTIASDAARSSASNTSSVSTPSN